MPRKFLKYQQNTNVLVACGNLFDYPEIFIIHCYIFCVINFNVTTENSTKAGACEKQLPRLNANVS